MIVRLSVARSLVGRAADGGGCTALGSNLVFDGTLVCCYAQTARARDIHYETLLCKDLAS